MSHLAFPRLHFRGGFTANVGTANNGNPPNPEVVDVAAVRVNTLGTTDAAFAAWLRGLDPETGRLRGGWNPYGDSGCGFQNATCHATEPAPGTLAAAPADDPAVGAAVQLLRGVMADQNPAGSTSTQLFAAQFSLSAAGVSVSGKPVRAVSRWVARRNLGVDGFTALAAVWHMVIPPAVLSITPGGSPSLLALKAAHDAGMGVAVRFCTYLLAPALTDAKLAAEFAAGHTTANPAVGRVIGTVGVWDPESMTTLAEGRRLGPGAAAAGGVRLNPATVLVDAAAGRVTVDLVNSVPEVDAGLEKADLGPLDLTATPATGSPVVLGTVPNTRAGYELRAGLVDFPLPPAAAAAAAAGPLSLVQRTTGLALLAEPPLVVETDDRVVYLQEGQSGVVRLRGWARGAAAGARVSIRQEVDVGPAAGVVSVPAHADLDAAGTAVVAVAAAAPGCCTLSFAAAGAPDDGDYFACVRVLPADDFSAVPDDQITFPFVYDKVLRYYHLLHPAMDRLFDLSSPDAVELKADRVRTRVKMTAWDDPLYMPRTRDLSAGKAELLLRWCDIVSPTGP